MGMSRAWNKWHASAMESKECARQMQRAVMRLVAAELSKSFGQWREVSIAMVSAERLMGGAVKRLMEDGAEQSMEQVACECDGEQGVCSTDAESSDEAGGSRAEQELWAVARCCADDAISQARGSSISSNIQASYVSRAASFDSQVDGEGMEQVVCKCDAEQRSVLRR